SGHRTLRRLTSMIEGDVRSKSSGILNVRLPAGRLLDRKHEAVPVHQQAVAFRLRSNGVRISIRARHPRNQNDTQDDQHYAHKLGSLGSEGAASLTAAP